METKDKNSIRERKRYSNAPISEVIIGITWDRPLLQDKGLFFYLYNKIQENFPIVQFFQPLVNEELINYRLQADFDLNKTGPNLCRLFSLDRNFLVQIQFNKIYTNWIRLGEEDSYPGFENLLNSFYEILNLVSHDDLYSNIKSLEITYQNRFPWSKYMEDLSSLDEFLNYKPPEINIQNQKTGLNNIFSRYIFPETKVNGFGSISLNTSTDIKDGKTQLLTVEYTLKGTPGESRGELENWLESAHSFQYEQFVNFFKDSLKNKWE